MSRIVHFEIGADNPDQMIKFYEDTFDWKIQKWDGPQDYWLVTTGEEGKPGINGGIFRNNAHMPGIVNTVDVSSVDDFSAKIIAHGGKIVMEKIAIPGVGYLAYCQDTEGNTFGIMQDDRSAQ